MEASRSYECALPSIDGLWQGRGFPGSNDLFLKKRESQQGEARLI